MDLEFSDEEAELRENVRTVLSKACPPALVRDVFEGKGTDDKLWSTMTELYWPALAISEDHDGLGMGFFEVAIVAEQLGAFVAPVPFLATVTQFVPAVQQLGDAAAQARLLAPVAAGELTGTLALGESGRWSLDAIEATATQDGDRWHLSGTKTSVFDGESADEVIVIARTPGSSGRAGLGAFVVPRADLAVEPRVTIDPTMPVADLRLDGVSVTRDRVLAEPADSVADRLDRAVEEATVSLAMATVGACREIFERTLEYAKVREQYGRPIGSFQALKHRFADSYLALERATSLCYYAALTIAEDDDARHEAASLAKAAAGECQRLLTGEGLQLHGGIGYTWENDLHFVLKRAKSGDALFGSAFDHRGRLARMLGLVADRPGAAEEVSR